MVREFLGAKLVSNQGEQARPGDVADSLWKLVAIYRFLDDQRRALTAASLLAMSGGQSPLGKRDALSTPGRAGQGASFSPPRGL